MDVASDAVWYQPKFGGSNLDECRAKDLNPYMYNTTQKKNNEAYTFPTIFL
jgi:hypothetical protein